MMIGDAGNARARFARTPRLQLTPTSGLALGLLVSAAIWAGAAEMVHLFGLI